MHIERTAPNEITITGNIKTTADYLEIRTLAARIVDEGASALRLVVLESLSMPSAVIGFFVKLVKRDKIRLTMVIQDHRLLELLDELSLAQDFGATLRP